MAGNKKVPTLFSAGTDCQMVRFSATGLAHRLEALHTDLHAAESSVDDSLDGAKVRCEDSLVHVVGM